MPLFSSGAGSGSNQSLPHSRKEEHRCSDDLKIHYQPQQLHQHDAVARRQRQLRHHSAYEQPARLIAATTTTTRRSGASRSEGRSSRRPSQTPRISSSSLFDQSSPFSVTPTKSAPEMLLSALQPTRMQMQARLLQDPLQDPSLRKLSKISSESPSVPSSSSVSAFFRSRRQYTISTTDNNFFISAYTVPASFIHYANSNARRWFWHNIAYLVAIPLYMQIRTRQLAISTR
jgi:hypothetical protein